MPPAWKGGTFVCLNQRQWSRSLGSFVITHRDVGIVDREKRPPRYLEAFYIPGDVSNVLLLFRTGTNLGSLALNL